ncbi:MAG TPA: hypothetical protein VNX88_01755 [Terriglobales bacterium]|jgi:hypothetical protein|nr:hypothetical protein [Terriglobales bacterium]
MKHSNWKLSLGAGLTFLVLAAQAWAGRPKTYYQIDVPGALVTIASGINNDGYIVGWYCVQNPCSGGSGTELNPRVRGFVRNPDGSFIFLNVNNCSPGNTDCNHAVGTQPRYISPQGVVIGAYFALESKADGTPKAGNPRFRGFACQIASCSGPNQQIVYFDAPLELYDHQSPDIAHSIIPRGINAEGDVVGCIHDQDQMNSMHGFRLHDGKFSTLSDGSTMNNGINPQGDVVGLDFMNLAGYRLDKDGNVVETISFPGPGIDETDAWDINAKGEIVGQAFTNNFGVGHAFLRSKQGDYGFVDPPEQCSTCSSVAFAIAGNGNIVGQYRNSFSGCSVNACVHGFLLQRGDD